jgi:hypothetical protein
VTDMTSEFPLEQARARFADFRQQREQETRAAIERVLGPTAR